MSVKQLLSQLKDIATNPLQDIHILHSDDPLIVNAIIIGPENTPYHNGAFRLQLQYTHQYPANPPAAHFITKVFHPNVSTKGEVCVNTLKRDWTSKVTIRHVLTIIKCLLIHPGPDSALNEEAGKLLMESYESFASKAAIYTSVHAIPIPKAMELARSESISVLQVNESTINSRKRPLEEVKKKVNKNIRRL